MAILVQDTFTGAPGTTLPGHTPDSGGSWSYHTSYGSSGIIISTSNRIRSGTGSASLAIHSATLASADYSVKGQLTFFTGTSQTTAVVGRVDPAANTFYRLLYDVNIDAFKLSVTLAGTITSLGTSATGYSAPCVMELKMIGDQISGLIDGVTVVGPVTNSTITAAGRAGVYFSGSTLNTTGGHLDNFLVEDPPVLVWRPREAVVMAEAPPIYPGAALWLESPMPASDRRVPAKAPITAEAPPRSTGTATYQASEAIQQVSLPKRPSVTIQEPPPQFPGAALVGSTRRVPMRGGQRSIIVQAEAQASYPGSVQWAKSPIPASEVTVGRRTVAVSESPPPHAGSVLYLAADSVAVPFTRMPYKVTATAEAPPIYPGSVILDTVQAPTIAPVAVPMVSRIVRAESPAPFPGAVLWAQDRTVVVAQSSTPRRAIIVMAEAPPPYPGAVIGSWDLLGRRPPKDTLAGLYYRVYANAGSGAIDYGTVLITTPSLTWTTAALSYAADWKFGVRAYSGESELEESNLDAAVEVILDSAGADITDRPGPPKGLTASATLAGSVRLEWTYPPQPGGAPTGFHVYQGIGSVSYAVPVATVAYGGAIGSIYRATITGLADGSTYLFGVRSYNATSEEVNTLTVSATADAVGPPAVDGLTGTAVSASG